MLPNRGMLIWRPLTILEDRMRFTQILEGIDYILKGQDADISEIEYDSRRVQSGNLFCCVSGTYDDGHRYAQQAVDAGASALLVERELPIDIPQAIVPDVRLAMAEAAANFFGNPSRGMRFAGVTGTNGMTSTTYMLKTIAEQQNIKVGLIGTIHIMIGSEVMNADRTTPASVDLQRTLRRMRDAGVELVIMEVSSHSLDQKRVYGIEFDTAAFTNLTQDHMDYHKTFDNYLMAKKKLFYSSKNAVINVDDVYAERIMEGIPAKSITFGVRNGADINATEIEITAKGVQFDLATPEGAARVNMPIPGLFNVFNAMAATGLALNLGFDLKTIKKGLESMHSVSGRLEPLSTNGKDFNVFLDFAHTPDALENILKTVHTFSKGRIITVFGCGGDRDRAKRPIMGEAAGRFSDLLIVTSDNPRTEDPFDIIASIEEGVKRSGCAYKIIENRREAIRYALAKAMKDDCIILAGKGHENYQEINGVKHHFDEKEIVAELLNELD